MANKTWFLPNGSTFAIETDAPYEPKTLTSVKPTNVFEAYGEFSDSINKQWDYREWDYKAMPVPLVERPLFKDIYTVTPEPKPPEPTPAQTPNKAAAADPRWNNKVAWGSKDLFKRQESLETYSAEVAMMVEAVRQIAAKSINRQVTNEELDFFANFGSPIINNKQLISIGLYQPVDLKIQLTRQLINGKLDWSADVGITDKTELQAAGRIYDINNSGGKLSTNQITTTDDQPAQRKQRKVRL